VRRIARRQHEGGLAIAEFDRDLLHAGVAQALGIEDNGERIAGKRLVGEYIGGDITARHKASMEGGSMTGNGVKSGSGAG
jgi:hypothetical protein